MHIIITGTSRGIGFEVLRRFLEDNNHKIIALSRNISSLVIFKNNPSVRFFPFDIMKREDHTKLMNETNSFLDGKVDILINNAGVLINKPVAGLSPLDYDIMFNTHVKGVFFLIQKLLPKLTPGSHIVNIGSMGGYQGSKKFAGLSLYAASKGALSILTECLAEELKPDKINVNMLSLGAVDTEMLQEAFPGNINGMDVKKLSVFIKDFAQKGQYLFNGKNIPVASTTP
ncbi:MAG: SDR family oxidoreductase [Bacteroidota bacterium]